MTVVELLRAARAVIERPEDFKASNGLWAHVYIDGVSSYALQNPQAIKAGKYLVLGMGGGDFGDSATFIWRWQDEPARTHAEVLAAFDNAIALAERDNV